MEARRKIAAVSYLNTIPFIYGIQHTESLCADLSLSPPAGCAEAYASGAADIALVPVGALPRFQDARIITSYCIGAVKSVRTVVLMSNSPIADVSRIWLDAHSVTSALLVRVLAAELWNIKPEWKVLEDYSVADHAEAGDAFLLIGDKVFDFEGKFAYSLDLADCWRTLTNKPFVFAVWIAREGTDPALIEELEEGLTLGVERVWEAIVEYGHSEKPYAYEYLTSNIDFLFDNQKQKALELFREKIRKIAPHAKPG